MGNKSLKPESEQTWKTPLAMFTRWLLRNRGEDAKADKADDQSKREFLVDETGMSLNTAAELYGKKLDNAVKKVRQPKQSGGIVGEGAMSAKTQKQPKKKKIPQYYKGGGKVKKNYAYGGRVAKYKG